MKYLPPLHQVLEYLSTKDLDMTTRIKCFDFLCDRLGPHGMYQNEYSRISYSRKKTYKFLPAASKHPFDGVEHDAKSELQSPVSCFSEESCGIMGFPVLDSKLGENTKLYGSLFQCAPEPEANVLMQQLANLVASAKLLHKKRKKQGSGEDPADYIIATFTAIFMYLSHRTSELTELALRWIKQEDCIPCRVDGGLEWFRPDQVFFRSSSSDVDQMTEDLFHVIDFSPFLAAAGVRQEATTKDIFMLMLADPEKMLDTLGSEKKYRSLLRRIAANPPFSRVTAPLQNTAFLLAYSVKPTEEKKTCEESLEPANYHLAKAEDIYIIDNSFFGRMFAVDRAPHESDLEDFYVRLGSKYISKSVERRFEVVGKPDSDTKTTRALKQRLLERGPLLVSPNITTRPLVNNAAAVLSEKKLTFYEASNLMAVYSLGGKTRRNRTTCFSRSMRGKGNNIFVVDQFDWFDVGYAIGDLILTRCQLEDAFFISSLLEAPLEQLRARGFPVDRVIQPEIKAVEKPKAVAPPPAAPAPVNAPQSSSSSKPKDAASENVPTAPPQAEPALVLPAATTAAPAPSSVAAETSTVIPPSPAKGSDKENPQKPEKKPKEAAKLPEQTNMDDILLQMFPDADRDFVRSVLGPNPSLDDVRALADQMASGGYPKDSAASDAGTASTAATNATSQSPPKKEKTGSLRKRLGRALTGRRGPGSKPLNSPRPPMGGGTPILPNGDSGITGPTPTSGGIAGPNDGRTKHEASKPVNPATDAQSQAGLERMLAQTVQGSSQVLKQGIDSPDARVTTSSLPEGLDRGETCEVIPGQSLQPFAGSRGDSKTINGIRVFSWKALQSSYEFLQQNEDATEQFGLVLQRLSEVYSIPISSIAIYHDPVGQTIAFNSNKALHFNLRFFYALHYLPGKSHDPACYSYWYVTMAHELSHHLVSAHNKEHGFYTESYTAQYMPNLMDLLRSLG